MTAKLCQVGCFLVPLELMRARKKSLPYLYTSFFLFAALAFLVFFIDPTQPIKFFSLTFSPLIPFFFTFFLLLFCLFTFLFLSRRRGLLSSLFFTTVLLLQYIDVANAMYIGMLFLIVILLEVSFFR